MLSAVSACDPPGTTRSPCRCAGDAYRRLRAADGVDVVALRAVREPREEGRRLALGRQGLGEILRHVDLARALRQAHRDTDRVSAPQAGGISTGSADADHVLAAHHSDRAPILE